jgi:hypothetical protein
MAIVVDRDATTVHAYLPRFDGLEGFFVSGEGVVERQGHWVGSSKGLISGKRLIYAQIDNFTGTEPCLLRR